MNIPAIRNDTRGHGYYGAPRGSRGHRGLDFLSEHNNPINAFKGGVITKYGYPYADDLSFRYIQIQDKEGYCARYFYVERVSGLNVGDEITAGQHIGSCQDIASRYQEEDKEDMQLHWHFEVKKGDVYFDPSRYIAEA